MDYKTELEKNSQLLADFLLQNEYTQKDCVILEKNENSFLVPFCKAPTQEFFEKVFGSQGAFWKMHLEFGIGEVPFKKKYAVFLNNQMYFCINLEQKYFYSLGPKKIPVIKENKLSYKTKLSIDWFMRTLSAPIDVLTQAKQIMSDAFIANDALIEFEKEEIEAQSYWEQSLKKQELDATDAASALEKAAHALRFSIIFSLAQMLKLKPSKNAKKIIKETKAILSYSNVPGKQNWENGFLAENIYDISRPRIMDAPNGLFLRVEVPNEPWMALRESAKLIIARYLAVERSAYLQLGKKTGLGEDVFYIMTTELLNPKNGIEELKRIAQIRKKEFINNYDNLLPKRLIYNNNWFFEQTKTETQLSGMSVGAQIHTKGPATLIQNSNDLKKNCSGKIIVTTFYSPELVVAYTGALGIISSVGGALSHPSIVAREHNLPCIVQVNSIESIKENDLLEVDGKSGKIKLLGQKQND